jgi:nucleotide-binding universal stress UspA family protein
MKLLVCSDGSERAAMALASAAIIAEATKAETTILGISESKQEEGKLLEALREESKAFHQPELKLEILTKYGDPVAEIIRHMRETAYDLLVIGAESKGAEGFFLPRAKAYSITEAVAPPVLVVPVLRQTMKRILICSGGGTYIANAVRFTSKLAKCLQADITLLTVTPQPPAMHGMIFRRQENVDALLKSNSTLARNLQNQKQIIEQTGIRATIRVRCGIVIDQIIEEVEQNDYDLVVAGSWPVRDAWRNYAIGNITRQILNQAGRPVLVLRSDIVVSSLKERLRNMLMRLRGKQDFRAVEPLMERLGSRPKSAK